MESTLLVRLLLIITLISSSGCSNLFYYPSKVTYSTPENYNIDYEDIYFVSKDGTKLHGWHLRTKDKVPKGLVIQYHGNAQNLSSHFIALSWLVNNGYDVFIFDYRGYGKSEGTVDREGIYEDSLSALDYAYSLKEKREAKSFIVYGQSIGGIIATRAVLDKEAKVPIDLLILESTFSSYQEIAFDKLTDHWFTIILSPMAYLTISERHATKHEIGQLKTKLLVIHGESDNIVPLKFGEEIHKSAKTDKEFWSVKGGGHINTYFIQKGAYREKLINFLSTHHN